MRLSSNKSRHFTRILWRPTLKHDPSFLEKYLADDYMAIRNDGKLTTKGSGDREL